MKTIRLVVFNEDYWSKGLIYTQNILPLMALMQTRKYNVEIVSFTSFLIYLKNWKQIHNFSEELSQKGIKLYNYLTCYYPTRFMINRWFMLPFLFLNTVFYIWALRLRDRNKSVQYNLRSYDSALSFYLSYGNRERLFFDTRTDWIEEGINAGYFKGGSLSAKMWLYFEDKMVRKFAKSIFISEQFRQNVLERHGISMNSQKFVVLYNPIDFAHFKVPKEEHIGYVFLYTGSFGRWNRLELYLDFFLNIAKRIPESRMIICTSTSKLKVCNIINYTKYSTISDLIEVHYNVPSSELPKYYGKCDFGLQLMSKKDSRIGVKVVEYIASGLTPIVSKNVLGASQLVDKYGFGITFDDSDSIDDLVALIKTKKDGLDRSSAEYKAFQDLSDLNGIENRLEMIYSNE